MEDNEEEITSHELWVVARSKMEAYDVLTTQGRYYFPPIESTRADFVADVRTEAKKVQFQLLFFYRSSNAKM